MKFKVYAEAIASIFVGEYEADNWEEAERIAQKDSERKKIAITLCTACADEVDVGEICNFSADYVMPDCPKCREVHNQENTYEHE